MMYRVLGGIALALGAVFGLITLLVLLPFLSNYNISLLVLAAVFGVIAYVFLAIGWQLTHPPKPRRREVESREEPIAREETVAREEAVAEVPAVPTPAGAPTPAPTSAGAATPAAATPAAATPAAPTQAPIPAERPAPVAAATPEAGVPEAGVPEAGVPEAVPPAQPSVPPSEEKGAAGAIEPGAGFAGFDEAAAEPSKPSTNGEARQAAAPRFKKPGAPVPHHESRR